MSVRIFRFFFFYFRCKTCSTDHGLFVYAQHYASVFTEYFFWKRFLTSYPVDIYFFLFYSWPRFFNNNILDINISIVSCAGRKRQKTQKF